MISEEIIKGDRASADNPFCWDIVVLNLPGQKGYDPTRPWIYRYDNIGQAMASFVMLYVNDLQTGSNKGRKDCEKVTHVAGSKLNYLGEQDASRKRGEASQEPGAWAGSVIVSEKDKGLFVTVSQEKWDKVKAILDKYHEVIVASDRCEKEMRVDFKQLERDTGFLVHVFMTNDHLRPYLEGFYLTLNSWRYNRDDEGWARSRRDWENIAEEYWKKEGERCDEGVAEPENNMLASAPNTV